MHGNSTTNHVDRALVYMYVCDIVNVSSHNWLVMGQVLTCTCSRWCLEVATSTDGALWKGPASTDAF